MTTQVQYEDDGEDLFTNKSTVLANFEEWIKMATDNKINSRNSWNFALIDYFHDLNVLKDSEDNINFQKASATLDGCVKIYSSRVDSVANETGKLLSGLAERRNREQQASDEVYREQGSNDVRIDPATGLPVTDDNSDNQTRRRTYNRVLETTLVGFDAIKMRELDQELTIDPLFKKALADFDEGGAKSLLLNTLSIDQGARIVFDATTNQRKKRERNCNLQEQEGSVISTQESMAADEEIENSLAHETNEHLESSVCETPSSGPSTNKEGSVILEDEILALGIELISFDEINSADICPSMPQLKSVVEDIHKAKSFIDDVNSKFDNFLTDQDLQDAIPENLNDNDYDYEVPNGDDGENGDDNEEMNNSRTSNLSVAEEDKSTIDIIGDIMDQDLMAYFDESLKKNWRGREHWKVRNFKKKIMNSNSNENAPSELITETAVSSNESNGKAKKQKKDSTVDFYDLDDSVEDAAFSQKKRVNIEMPQKLRHDPGHYLLPDDYQFSTDKITKLFIKPNQKMSFFSHRKRHTLDRQPGSLKFDDSEIKETSHIPEIADENFWAENYQLKEQEETDPNAAKENNVIRESALENPFEDEGGIDFNQAFEDDDLGGYDEEEGDNELNATQATGTTGPSQNLLKQETKISYSRVSKKVDVKRLKNNVWKSIIKRTSEKGTSNQDASEAVELKFTEIAQDIDSMYPADVKKDLSTSFCFICLLHLANEHGFSVTSTEQFDDLKITIEKFG